MMTELEKILTRQLLVEHSSLQSLMAMKLHSMQGSSNSVRALFLKNMLLFDSDQRYKKKAGRKGLPLD